MCTILHFDFYIQYKSVVSIHHTVDTPLPILPFPSVTTTLFSVSMCLFLFGLVSSFIFIYLFIFFFHICVKSYSIGFSIFDLFYLELHL